MGAGVLERCEEGGEELGGGGRGQGGRREGGGDDVAGAEKEVPGGSGSHGKGGEVDMDVEGGLRAWRQETAVEEILGRALYPICTWAM